MQPNNTLCTGILISPNRKISKVRMCAKINTLGLHFEDCFIETLPPTLPLKCGLSSECISRGLRESGCFK